MNSINIIRSITYNISHRMTVLKVSLC